MSRILIFSQHFYPENFRINEVAKWLSNNGNTVDVMTGHPNYPNGKTYNGYNPFSINSKNWNNLTIYRVPIYPRKSGGTVNLFINYISFILSSSFFSPIILFRKKYDVVFCYATSPFLQAIPALLIARISGAKLFINVQDLWPESLTATGYVTNKLILKIIGIIVGWLYRKSDLLLIQSRGFESHIRRYAPLSKVVYWPNSVDDSFIVDKKFSLKSEIFNKCKFNIVYAGNLGEAQSVYVILRLAFNLRNNGRIQFLIFGDGSRCNWLRNKITEFSLSNITLMGKWPVESMPYIMSSASVLLLTLSKGEIFEATIPNKLQAYLASGRPILAAINGEGARIINDAGAGLVAPAEDVEELTIKTQKFINMTVQELNTFGNNGKKYFIENFRHVQLMDKLIDHINLLMNKGSV